MQNDMVNMGGLWKNISANGIEYLSGSFGNAKMMVFKNENKSGNENAPDYRVCFANKQRREEEGATDSTPSAPSPSPSANAF